MKKFILYSAIWLYDGSTFCKYCFSSFYYATALWIISYDVQLVFWNQRYRYGYFFYYIS